jgi:hypothetical protein
MKITEFLKKTDKEEHIILDVLVRTDNNKLVVVSDSVLNDFDKNCETFSFELVKPTFEIISQAVSALYGVGGQVDTIGAGKVIFDGCYIGNQGELSEVQGFAELYAGLCAKCSDKAELAYVDYKKK